MESPKKNFFQRALEVLLVFLCFLGITMIYVGSSNKAERSNHTEHSNQVEPVESKRKIAQAPSLQTELQTENGSTEISNIPEMNAAENVDRPEIETPKKLSPPPALKESVEEKRPPVALLPITPDLEEKNPAKEFWIWIGFGANYQYYKQSVPSVSGDIAFQNIQGPNSVFRAGFQGEQWGLDFAYKNTPGKMESSATTTVKNGSYEWKTISLDGFYRDGYWNYHLGLQHHQMPFMVLNAVNSEIDVKTNTLTLLTLGFDRNFYLSPDLRVEWLMRYQHPFFAGSSDGTRFKVTPKIAFDGSLGGVYSVSKNTRLGIYWYGQWHDYAFEYGSGAQQLSGSQFLFHSSVELRLGLEF